MKIRLISIILVCLNALAVYSQPRSRQDKDQVPTLYRITENDKRSGRRRFGFIDHTGKVIIDFDRLPKKQLKLATFTKGAP
jgi:hypothetical protein